MIATKTSSILARILVQYGLDGAHILPPQSGYRNRAYPIELTHGQKLNLILYKSEPGIVTKIRHANAVADFLAAQGMPTRRTYDPRIIRLRTPAHDKFGSLYHYLPGHTIPWEAYTKHHIKQLGGTMSHMHATLHDMATRVYLRPVTDEYHAIIGRMSTYFSLPEVRTALHAKLGLTPRSTIFTRLEHILQICETLPHQQALHMDFVRGNILFEGAGEGLTISGILDFEKTAHGHPVFDIARTLAFLLVDCKYKTPAQVHKYFLVSGYNKRGNMKFELPIIENDNHRLNLLEELLNLFLLYDWYKFLRHNPYESLTQNEHYIRTTDLLIKRKALQVTDRIQ